MTHWTVRPARLDEKDALNNLIHGSARALSETDYSPEQIEGLIQFVFGVDSELVLDQTYFVVEKEGIAVACGGWSKRRTLFGGDACKGRDSGYLDPSKDAAKIRAFFVHPDFSRQGLAKLLMGHCEKAAKEFGFIEMELMSTVPGIKFYQSQGYEGDQKIHHTLPNGIVIELLPMRKTL